MPKAKKEKDKWTWEGTEFHHCPKCSKAIPTAWTQHKECGWDMNEDVAKDDEIFKEEEMATRDQIGAEAVRMPVKVPGISQTIIDQAACLMGECKERIEKEFRMTIDKKPEIIPCINSIFIEICKRSRT